ncbi:MAG: FAD-dependent oxidoreductase [Desulfarculaceae bacterium]|nr:FAD-dependent oxidoreductase [Desulfarculaceae bacterium]MCF8073028.1 FAD-dependent oxidoreductase [Desulfarculaceae bacterium]MCF8101887.1 FAD-dependent oxidoreductase [Desulfarculaceae bacterium]MCF8115414.1 FAD-dependent oxidoreductase [Desulfarculaceae bacterium]
MAEKRVLVIGGGVAGATAALELAEQGVPVDLVERDDFLGGHAAWLACKAVDQCLKCNGCLSEPRLTATAGHPLISLHRRAEVQSLTATEQGYQAVVCQRPAYIDPERCTACGLCLEACPALEDGAIRLPRLAAESPRLAIDPEQCLYFKDGRSTVCVDLCPEEAIDFRQEDREKALEVSALVLATGFTPFDPTPRERLGYGRFPDVVTAFELERMLRDQGRAIRPSDGRPANKVAFIQCVGSREVAGNNYCSRVCCGYALRLGRALSGRQGCEVAVFYMDLQSFGHAVDDFLDAAASELRLIRSMPYDVYGHHQGGLRVDYQPGEGQAPVSEPFDLVVLSVGLSPNPANQALAKLTGAGLDESGFLDGTGRDGVFLAGTALGPMDVAEAVASAGRAVEQTLGYLEEMQP